MSARSVLKNVAEVTAYLQYVDTNSGGLADKKKQQKWFDDYVKVHQPRRQQGDAEILHTASSLRACISKSVARHRLDHATMDDVNTQGSRALKAAYLERIDYSQTAPSGQTDEVPIIIPEDEASPSTSQIKRKRSNDNDETSNDEEAPKRKVVKLNPPHTAQATRVPNRSHSEREAEKKAEEDTIWRVQEASRRSRYEVLGIKDSSLADTIIREKMDSVRQATLNVAGLLCSDADLDPGRTAVFEMKPSTPLTRCYNQLLLPPGESDWKRIVIELMGKNLLGTREALQALIGSFLLSHIFARSVPWTAPHDQINALKSDHRFIARLMPADYEELLRVASIAKLNHPGFQDEIKKYAHPLACKLAFLLLEHLGPVLKQSHPVKCLPSALDGLCEQALKLRARMDISEDHYIPTWPKPGQAFDRKTMMTADEDVGSTVELPIMPGFQCISSDERTEDSISARAQVLI